MLEPVYGELAWILASHHHHPRRDRYGRIARPELSVHALVVDLLKVRQLVQELVEQHLGRDRVEPDDRALQTSSSLPTGSMLVIKPWSFMVTYYSTKGFLNSKIAFETSGRMNSFGGVSPARNM